MKFFVFFVCCIVSLSSFGLEAKEVLKKMGDVYKNLSVYEVTTKYELFKGEKATHVETTYDGYMMRNKTNFYQKIDKTEFVYTAAFSVKISHSEKVVELMKGQEYKNQDIDFEKTIQECKEIKMEEKEGVFYITMFIKNTSQVPFSYVKVKVSKTNFHLLQLDLFYAELEDFSDDYKKQDLHRPHVRIGFSKFSKKPSVKDSVFDFETYFSTVKNKISPLGSIKSYELIDYRVN